MREAELRARLLAWYDTHARELPWRVGPQARAAGVCPDPYHVWLSEVMLQQTTVAVVRQRYARFLSLWPGIEALAAASEAEVMAEWAGLGYYARARNLHACAREVAARGAFPTEAAELARLPGIGPYTSAAIAAIAFDRPAAVMDGNVERVMARLFAVETPLPQAKPRLRLLLERLVPGPRPGDLAQAMMDLGATICTPRAPGCARCPLADLCLGRALGLATSLPRRQPRAARPVRQGLIYVARREDGAWLLERRPPQGLLGGTLGFPTSVWREPAADDAAAAAQGAHPVHDDAPPLAAAWQDPGLELRHTFTHFHLRLRLRLAEVGHEALPARGSFMPADEFRPAALPSLMRKAHALAVQAGFADTPQKRPMAPGGPRPSPDGSRAAPPGC